MHRNCGDISLNKHFAFPQGVIGTESRFPCRRLTHFAPLSDFSIATRMLLSVCPGVWRKSRLASPAQILFAESSPVRPNTAATLGTGCPPLGHEKPQTENEVSKPASECICARVRRERGREGGRASRRIRYNQWPQDFISLQRGGRLSLSMKFRRSQFPSFRLSANLFRRSTATGQFYQGFYGIFMFIRVAIVPASLKYREM